MKEDFPAPAQAADLLDGLHDADLVVDCHDGDERGVGADGGLEDVEVDDAVFADREVGDFEAFLGELAAGVEDALVLLEGSQ